MATASTPNRLLNELLDRLKLKSDSQLGKRLGVCRSAISRIRTNGYVTADMLIRMHDVSRMSVKRLRELGGMPEPDYLRG